jgi:hypothetical protein
MSLMNPEIRTNPWDNVTNGAPKIFKAVISMKREIGAVGKSGKADMKGSGAKYDYRRFDDVLDAVAPLMNEHSIMLVPNVVTKEERQDGNKHFVVMQMAYRLYAEDGSFIEGSAIGEAFDTGDKAATKAQTVALRIFYCSTFNIPYEEMKDPEDGEQHQWNHRRQGTLSRMTAALDSLQDATKLRGMLNFALKLHNQPFQGDVLSTDDLKVIKDAFTSAARRLRFPEPKVLEIAAEIDAKIEGRATADKPVNDMAVEPIKIKELDYDFSIAADPNVLDRMVMTTVQSFRAGHISRTELSELCSKQCPEDPSRGAAVYFLGALERCGSAEELGQTVADISGAMQNRKISGDVGKALTNLGQALIDAKKAKGSTDDAQQS